MNHKKIVGVVMLLSITMSMTAYAGTWKTGKEESQNKWWYANGDGSYAKNGWYWIDGNNDGVAECYYFDDNGWMLSNMTTPDGYLVNSDGAWIENGEVVTQESILVNKEQLSETKKNQKLSSVLMRQKGRPIREVGVPEGIYSAWQLESEKYEIVADSRPAEIRNQANGYYYIYDERGFLVREYQKRLDFVNPYTGEVVTGKGTKGKVYEYDASGRLKAEWDIKASLESKNDTRTMVPTMDDVHNEYEYDSAGRLVRKWIAKSKNGINKYTNYFYDTDGRLVKTVTDNHNESGATGGLENQTNYIYNDKDGTIIIEFGITEQEIPSEEGGGIHYAGMFVCDEQGRIIERQIGNTPGAPSAIYQYTYDEKGRVIKSELLNGDRNPGTCIEYTYKD